MRIRELRVNGGDFKTRVLVEAGEITFYTILETFATRWLAQEICLHHCWSLQTVEQEKQSNDKKNFKLIRTKIFVKKHFRVFYYVRSTCNC